jgi:hypothetical protein
LRLLDQAALRLRRSGVTLAPHSTPRQIAQRLQQLSRQPTSQRWQDWLIQLESLRYAQPTNPGHTTRFKKQIATLHNDLKSLHWPP